MVACCSVVMPEGVVGPVVVNAVDDVRFQHSDRLLRESEHSQIIRHHWGDRRLIMAQSQLLELHESRLGLPVPELLPAAVESIPIEGHHCLPPCLDPFLSLSLKPSSRSHANSMNFRRPDQFRLEGLEDVNVERALVAITHNLHKL
jgi:hypothetical protein